MTTATLSPALRALIDERLDGIDRVLRHARMPRPERLEILDSVENQILEMLARRAAEDPTRRDLLAVLAELDPPEAYAFGEETRRRAPDVEPPPQPKSVGGNPTAAPVKWSTLAILAGAGVLVWMVGAGLIVLAVFAIGGDSGGAFLFFGLPFLVLAALVNTGIGVWAMVTIARSNGALKGMAFAAAGACLPVLFLFHVVALYAVAAFASSDSLAFLLFLGIPYVVSLPLPVAWALFERFRYRRCPGA